MLFEPKLLFNKVSIWCVIFVWLAGLLAIMEKILSASLWNISCGCFSLLCLIVDARSLAQGTRIAPVATGFSELNEKARRVALLKLGREGASCAKISSHSNIRAPSLGTRLVICDLVRAKRAAIQLADCQC